jgi:hypothetical protein
VQLGVLLYLILHSKAEHCKNKLTTYTEDTTTGMMMMMMMMRRRRRRRRGFLLTPGWGHWGL